MKINWTRYDKACAERERDWALQDQVLYDLCRQHSRHNNAGVVNAKLSIIGRSYSTGIERQIKSKGTLSSSLEQLAAHVLTNHRKVDAIFGRLSGVAEPLDPPKLHVILAEHGRLVILLQPILRKGLSPRSFASKYMHFHCPAVPVYDSLAAAALRKLYPWERTFEIFELPLGADEDYGRYVLRFWQLYQDAGQARKNVTVKCLDRFILALRVPRNFCTSNNIG